MVALAIAVPALAQENIVRVLAGDRAIKDSGATVICTDDPDAKWSTLGVQVSSGDYHTRREAWSVLHQAARQYNSTAAWMVLTPRKSEPGRLMIGLTRNSASNFCVAFAEPRGPARAEKVEFPIQSEPTVEENRVTRTATEETVAAAPYRVTAAERNDRETNRVVSEPQQEKERNASSISPLARWNSALAELRRIARQVSRNTSRTERAVMEDGLKGVRDILDNNAEASEASVGSSFHSWNVAITELRGAATDIAELELSKSMRSAMKADIKDVENALNKKKSRQKKLGIF
jgi:hypothetical protein